ITYDLDKVRSVVARIAEIDANLVALKNEENRLGTVGASLAPWRSMPLALEETETTTAKIFFGTMPSTIPIEEAAGGLLQAAPESHIEAVSSDQELHYIVLVAHRSCEDEAQQALKSFGFSRIQFKELSGTPERNIDDVTTRLAEIASKREDHEKQIRQLSSQKTRLQVLYDYLQIRVERNKVVSKIGRSDSVFYLEGWLPSKSVDGFVARIKAEAECLIEISEPQKGEDHPILLHNPGIIKPFEAITSMYSLPSTRDVDPNLLMAPFYFLFFGMMIGDFAYGIILSIIIGIMILKLKPRGVAGQMLRMLFLGGLSTAFWGVMFGSYFGNLPQAMMGWVTGADYGERFYGLWFDPLSDPMKLLIFSMLFGVVHLFVGMGIKMYTLIRDGDVFAAIFDVGSWYLFIIGLPLLILGIFPGLYLTILGAAMLVLTQGRTAKNPVMKFLNGVLSLYGITGYLSDVLSYSRLLALGLATGVIAAVINTLAMLNAPGVVAGIVCVVVVAFGSVFNIAINALGAFVHSSRLQYVEFFSKFYEGGGEAFRPFEIKTKYIRVISQG
ncbi:MAG: V-type ATP synthase subunit I, partial [Oscillospiraceae bacterium]|nr:V-type ATP synthase subunit I [Oscillospiraceae bacterium]